MKTIFTLFKSALALTILVIGFNTATAQSGNKELVTLYDFESMHPESKHEVLSNPSLYEIVIPEELEKNAVTLAAFQAMTPADQQSILNDPNSRIINTDGKTLRFYDDGVTYVVIVDEIISKAMKAQYSYMTQAQFNAESSTRQQHITSHPELFKIVPDDSFFD